jgi:hypothetical protein
MNRHLAARLVGLCVIAVGVTAVAVQASGGSDPTPIVAGHRASIECTRNGKVNFHADSYGSGTYSVDGSAPIAFQGGFDFMLSGLVSHTLTVTADDWPTFSESAGPCKQPEEPTTTTGATTTTVGATTTTACPDCTPNTNVIVPTTTATTTTEPVPTTGGPTTEPAPATTDAPATTVEPTPTVTPAPVVAPPSTERRPPSTPTPVTLPSTE